MIKIYRELLHILERNEGACLYWQLPAGYSRVLLEELESRKLVRLDEDLVVHPLAVAGEGGSYTMPTE